VFLEDFSLQVLIFFIEGTPRKSKGATVDQVAVNGILKENRRWDQ